MEHTPGPWHVDIKRGTVLSADEDIVAVMGSNVEGAPGANARLIAAAPALLKALENLYNDELAEWSPCFKSACNDKGCAHMRQARAAILAAKGD